MSARCLEESSKQRLKMTTNRVLVCLMINVFLVHKIEGNRLLKDVRLVNGTMPNEGIVITTEDCKTWETTCGVNLAINDVIIFCRHLGFAGANRAISNPPFGRPFDSTPTTHTNCQEDGNVVGDCTVASQCKDNSTGEAVCYGSNYLGCFVDTTGQRVLGDRMNQSFGGLTINKCLDFCRQHRQMVYAGVESGIECYCGDVASNITLHGPVESDDQCQFTCDGSLIESCGGTGRIAIFNLTIEPDYSPPPMHLPCDMTTPHNPMASSDMMPQSRPQSTSSPGSVSSSSGFSHETLPSSTDMTGTGSPVTAATPVVTSALPQTTLSPLGNSIALYAGIGGGGAGLLLLCIIIIILVCRYKSRRKDDGHYGMKNLAPLGNESPVGYENAIVTFPEAPQGATLPKNIKEEQGGEVAKDAFTAQMKRGTMLVEYVNMEENNRSKLGAKEPEAGLHAIYQNEDNHEVSPMVEYVSINEKNRPKVAPKPDAALRVSYQNKAGGSLDKRATSPKDPGDLDGLYAMSTKIRPEPDGGESGDLYAMPDKSRKSKMSHDTSVQPHADTSTDDEGNLYAMPDKNRASKSSVPVFTGDVDAMYAMPDKPRFRNGNDGDSTEMVENELYG